MAAIQRFLALALAAFFCTGMLFGCSKAADSTALVDGEYTAEFKEYDSYGYKDFIRVLVKDGAVVKVEYDAVNEEGKLRTMDTDYEKRMQSQQETYPQKYSGDLVNLLLESDGDINGVTDIAGATWSSQCFRALYTALLSHMQSGDTTHLLVDNVPEK